MIDQPITKNSVEQSLKELKTTDQNSVGQDLVLQVEKDALVTFAKGLRDDLGYNLLSDVTAVDWNERKPCFELVYRAYSFPDGRRISWKVPLHQDEGIESISSIWRNANWMERELWDMFGIKVLNHPDLRRILMPAAWIGHPLRKDFPLGNEEVQFTINSDDIEPQEVFLNRCFDGMNWREYIDNGSDIEAEYGAGPLKERFGKDTMIISMGPQHPSTHGVLRVILALEGEVVKDSTLDIGYVHTGIEKQGEQLTYQKALTLTDRTDYVAPLQNNLAYSLSVEKLLGIEIPERAQVLRVILAELTRISSHLIWLGTHALDLGAVTMFLWCFRDRENILDIFEMASGVRMMTSYINIGGLRDDIPEGFTEKVKAFLDYLPSKLDEYHQLLTNNAIWLERTKGIGHIDLETALSYGVTGPVLRALGHPWDVRKLWPYSGYENYEFDVPTAENGDVYDRYLVRMQEMRQSARIIKQAIDNLPDGPVQVEDYKIVLPPRQRLDVSMEALIHHFLVATQGFYVPAGDAYVSTESPRGEMGYYIVSDGGTKPYRMRMRAPSFSSLQALPAMSQGHTVADIVAILGSVDMIMGEVDR